MRYVGTDWSAEVVPIPPLRWYRFMRYDGTVSPILSGLGNYVEVRHGDFTSIYGHLYSVLVNAKQAVEAGQPIGISGSTGRSTGEHLHFQMEYKDKTIDPKPILDYINEVIRTVKGQISQQIDNELRRK